MSIRLQELLLKMKELEHEIADEIHMTETDFLFKVHGRKVFFTDEVKFSHSSLAKPILQYLRDSSVFNLFSAPLAWACLFPMVLLDLIVSIYQDICFPIYGIPKVSRYDYIVMDRSRLNYLNIIEKINCGYCSYFNGVISYIQEVAGRTEQYWCPIKHARRIVNMHSRYVKFLEFGDAESYRKHLDTVRRNFS